jgi:uncharacterized protein (DUF2062 family)
MIHATRAAIGKWLESLLHVHDSPHRTAAAFALGVFLGFSGIPPFLGVHTILALGLAFVLNLNRVAVLLGVYSNLPFVIAEWYAVTTAFGAWLLGTRLPPAFTAQIHELFHLPLLGAEFWHHLVTLLTPLLWPFVVGSTLGAAVLALIAYPIARTSVETGRRYAALRHAREAHVRSADRNQH